MLKMTMPFLGLGVPYKNYERGAQPYVRLMRRTALRIGNNESSIHPESLVNRQPQAAHKVTLKYYNCPPGNQISLILGKL